MASTTYDYSGLRVGVNAEQIPSKVYLNNSPLYRIILNGNDLIHKYTTYSGTTRFTIRYTFQRTETSWSNNDKCFPRTYYNYTMHLKKIELSLSIYSDIGDLSSLTLSSYSQVITQRYNTSGSKNLTTLSFSSSENLSTDYTTIWSGDIATQAGDDDYNTSITLAAPTFTFNIAAGDTSTSYTRSNSISSVSATSTATEARIEFSASSWSKEVQEY